MVTTDDPKAQKHDATDLLVIECQNNATQNDNADAAQPDPKSDDKERKKKMRRRKQELAASLLISVLLPVYIGLYTIISIEYTAASNDHSQAANQIALLALCYSNSVRHRGRLVKAYLLI
jgi:hypothetical protein